MGAEGEERPREVACYRAGDETGRLDLKEKKESAELKNHLSVSRAPPCFSGLQVPREGLQELGAETKECVGRKFVPFPKFYHPCPNLCLKLQIPQDLSVVCGKFNAPLIPLPCYFPSPKHRIGKGTQRSVFVSQETKVELERP